MIAESVVAFIAAQAELQGAGLGLRAAYAQTPDTAPGELRAPYALVRPLREMPQELWVLGDAQRKENPLHMVLFYCTGAEQVRQFRARFKRLIEAAKALDTDGLLKPGINYLAAADLLRDSGDQKTYFSDQPNWFAAPAPVVYKNEDAAGEPVVVGGGYTFDPAVGSVTFAAAQAVGDRIRASFKMGIIDFVLGEVLDFPDAAEADLANNPARYVAAFVLEPFFYIKTNANKYL